MSADLKAKLAQLKELHELGLLTDAELAEQKRALVGAAMGVTPVASSAVVLAGGTRVDGPSAGGAAPELLAGATVIDAESSLPKKFGSYRVLGVLGAGGMGTVVRARHEEEGWAEQQGGDVAIKLIHPHIASSPQFRRRFFAEAALGKRVQHPGLATVYDVVSEGAWLGTILEHVDGKELTEWIRPGGLPVVEVLSLLKPLAAALDHLHSQGIVHRDLKPANVKVRPDGQPVLLDLGIAKDVSGASSGHTKTMTTMGTSAWMAPEQADAKSVTPAADVYALGLVAYALLSGRLPWAESVTEHRILAHKLMGKLAPLSEVAPGVSAAVALVVMAALTVDPEQRPASCGELVSSMNSAGGTAEQARRQEAAEALVAEAASVGARLKLPDKVSARWLEKAEHKVDEIKQDRLRVSAEALVAEASSVGARLTLPDRVSARWLDKAQAKVAALVEQRRQAKTQAARSPLPRHQCEVMSTVPHRAVLIYSEGLSDERIYPISDDGFSIGRGRDNDVQIKNDTKVSRFHCRFFTEDGSWFIEDNNTSNGTLVNGELVTKRRLWGGAEIIIGDTLFRFL